MKQTISYADLETGEASKKAIEDSKFYLGDELYEKVLMELKKVTSLKEAQLGLSMIGIEGFPVKVLFEESRKLQ